jgi:hypothetical protein
MDKIMHWRTRSYIRWVVSGVGVLMVMPFVYLVWSSCHIASNLMRIRNPLGRKVFDDCRRRYDDID